MTRLAPCELASHAGRRDDTKGDEHHMGERTTQGKGRSTRCDWLVALALALVLQTGSSGAAPAPTKPGATKAAPVPKKPSGSASGGIGAAKPKPAPPSKPAPVVVPLGATFTSADLDRIFVGNQAGVLKVYAADKKTVVFTKDAPGTDMKGVDGTQWAPLNDGHRTAILGALGIGDTEVQTVARGIIAKFPSIRPQRTGVAILGVIGSHPAARLDSATGVEIRRFLGELLSSQKDVSMRRQAVLALALCATTDADTARSVVKFMASSTNAWETFTTRQYFEYHKDLIRSLPEAPEIRRSLETSGNPYASDIVKLLN